MTSGFQIHVEVFVDFICCPGQWK